MKGSPIESAEKHIKERLKEAAQTLRRLPKARLSTSMTAWPDVVRQSAEAYGYDRSFARPIPPRPDQITRMDEALPWLFTLEPEVRRVVWARASGVSWRRLEMMDGRSHTTLRKLENRGIQGILEQLSAGSEKRSENLTAYR